MSSQIITPNRRSSQIITPNRRSQQFFPDKSWEEDEEKKKKSLNMVLPGFSKDRLRINLNTRTRTLIVTGQKSNGLFNIMRLNERIQIDEECSLDGVHAKLLNNNLYITFPKK
ncbi:unnamed protein product [Citrullus colocynthis]|uniref:SHSP domain-containing protein n=1 Tax=Citrullus colocynthis TaxID=252529 RepID=A0ABP0XYW5_9ROSI